MSKKYNPFIYRNVEVVRIIDGDTVRLSVDVGFKMHYEDNFRLVDIDTPERGKPGFDEASDFMRQLLAESSHKDGEPRCLELEVTHRDKYGRYLAILRDQHTGENLNQRMVLEGHAKPYDGGAR